MKDRLIAAGTVLVFFLLLRTNANPTMWQIAITAVGLYECVLMFIRAFEDGTKKTVRKRKVARTSDSARKTAKGWMTQCSIRFAECGR